MEKKKPGSAQARRSGQRGGAAKDRKGGGDRRDFVGSAGQENGQPPHLRRRSLATLADPCRR